MEKWILVTGLLVGQFAFAGPKTLGWISDSDSVQATVVDALYDLYRIDSESKYPNGFVKLDHSGGVFINDGTNEVSCDSQALGMLTVQSYRCTFSETNLDWTTSSDSVQAVLFDALLNAREFKRWIKTDVNGGLSVAFGGNVLTCNSRSQGMLAVQEYRCVLK